MSGGRAAAYRREMDTRRRAAVLCLIASPAALAVGCRSAPPPERPVAVSNSGFSLDQLFTDDRGYTVYRFYDKGDYRYYVVAPDGTAQMVPSTRAARGGGTVDAGVGVGIGIGGGRIRGR